MKKVILMILVFLTVVLSVSAIEIDSNIKWLSTKTEIYAKYGQPEAEGETIARYRNNGNTLFFFFYEDRLIALFTEFPGDVFNALQEKYKPVLGKKVSSSKNSVEWTAMTSIHYLNLRPDGTTTFTAIHKKSLGTFNEYMSYLE